MAQGRARSLQATTQINRRSEPTGRGTGFDHVRYSYNRESEDNVRNCWTLVRQQSAKPFERVLEGIAAG